MEARLEELAKGADDDPPAFAFRSFDRMGVEAAIRMGEDSLRARRDSVARATPPAVARFDSIAAEREAQRRRDEVQRRREILLSAERRGWDPDTVALVIDRHVRVGMNEEMVRYAWGWPEDVNRTVTRFSSREQWVYGAGRYVYFEDGTVTAVQW